MRSLLVTTPVKKYDRDLNAGNITTAAWAELIASMDKPASAIELFNGSGSILKLAKGAIGSEVEIPYYVLPGGSSIMVPIGFANGERISAKAVDATANSGYLVINFFG